MYSRLYSASDRALKWSAKITTSRASGRRCCGSSEYWERLTVKSTQTALGPLAISLIELTGWNANNFGHVIAMWTSERSASQRTTQNLRALEGGISTDASMRFRAGLRGLSFQSSSANRRARSSNAF